MRPFNRQTAAAANPIWARRTTPPWGIQYQAVLDELGIVGKCPTWEAFSDAVYAWQQNNAELQRMTQRMCVDGAWGVLDRVTWRIMLPHVRAVCTAYAVAGLTSFVQNLVSIAEGELVKWKTAGGWRTEGDAAVRGYLESYYRAAGKTAAEAHNLAGHAAADTNPWSAAFISYLFATAGAGIDFPVHTAHSYYVTTLKANAGRDIIAYPLQAYNMTDVSAEVGDLVCVWRDADPVAPGAQQPRIGGQPVSYAAIDAGNWRHFASHCDLITRIEGLRAIAIGGNVGNRVAETTYNLDNDGRVNHAHGVAIVKNYK